jgi:hypothetical protein
MAKSKKDYQPTIQWQTVSVRLGDLVEWAKNPRQLSTKDGKQLEKGMAKFGLADPLIVNADGKSLIGGHQRRRILLAKHGPDIQVDVRVPSRSLDEKELEELAIRLNRNIGSWDMDLLANGFDIDTLLEWGFDNEELDPDLFIENDNNYSRNIEAPIYTPKGEKPAIKDLYDDRRANELIAEIDTTDLPEDEKEFLRIAARRHTVLNYKQIAEYYAHSDKNIQILMENSALVIIDFGRAIELGYVKLSEEISKQYSEDYPDA